MAAAHLSRSPSPLSSRPSTNPNSRNSENNTATRRSFSGNNLYAKPSVLTNSRRLDSISPSNNPSDFARRRSVGKESTFSSLKDFEEKENDEKEVNLRASSKFQSPAKGSKHFMSPTISAASKFTPSPRKKVLIERNDPVRSSISLSDGKAMFFSAIPSNLPEDMNSKPEMDSYQNPKPEIADFDQKETVSKPSKRVSFSDVPSNSLPESVITNSDSLKSESSLNDKISSPIAQLDADPSLPPYDPKTSFLSPRPQFLHYKPKPRIESLLRKEKGLDPDEFYLLEDNFMAEIMSDNFSESEGTEESQTEDSQKEQFEVTSSADLVLGAEETEDDPYVPEPSESLPISTIVDNVTSEENVVQKREKKQRVFSKLMCFSMVMLFLVACLSISIKHSPAFDGLVLEDFSLSDVSNFYHQSKFAASAKVNLDRLAKHVNQFSVDFMTFVSKMIKELGGGEKLGPLQFVNLTDMQEITWDEGQFMNNEVIEELVEDLEEDEMDLLEQEQGANEEIDSYESFEKEFDWQDDVLETEEALPLDTIQLAELEPDNVEINQREVVFETNTDDQLAAILQDEESTLEVSSVRAETENSNGAINLGSSTCADINSLNNKSPLDVNSLNKSENTVLSPCAMGISSLLAALSAFAAFLYYYSRNPSSANVMQTDNLLNNKHIYNRKPFTTEVDEIGESSCPSGMSSFQKSASYTNKELTNEVQSYERKTSKYSKRESLASSSSEFSMGSPSYGSFTTFERIPIKHANGEDEIITPVRRSSRIRNHPHVTSP